MTPSTIAATTIFPIEQVNLDDLKQFHLAEAHCFSLLSYGRVRIEAAGTPETVGTLVNMSKTEARQLLAFLSELDVRGDLRAEPIFYPPLTNAVRLDGTRLPETFGTVHEVQWDFTEQHTWDFWSDRSLLITNTYCKEQVANLTQAEAIALLAWLQELHGVKQDLH